MKIFHNINQNFHVSKPQKKLHFTQPTDRKLEYSLLRHYVDPKMMIKFSQVFAKHLAKRFINHRNVFLISRKSYLPRARKFYFKSSREIITQWPVFIFRLMNDEIKTRERKLFDPTSQFLNVWIILQVCSLRSLKYF